MARIIGSYPGDRPTESAVEAGVFGGMREHLGDHETERAVATTASGSLSATSHDLRTSTAPRV